jgi:cysteine desulfurase/selenocysteine lyase
MPSSTSTLDVAAIRVDFPALDQFVHGRPLVYLDNAATAQKPRAVLDAIARYYAHDNANVHRGVHALSERATAAYEGAREITRAFLNAASTHEIVFTRNATEGINLVSRAWGDANVQKGDRVLVTLMEHHSNFVPWQMLCERKGATLDVAPIDDRGELILSELERLITPRTKMVAVADIVALAHRAGAAVLVDGSQAVVHAPVDVQAIGADFYVFTGHKLYGPTGIGVLHGREAVLDAMPPFLGGGDMIRTVSVEKSTWNDLPYKFEAGTPNIADAIGLGAAIQYVTAIGLEPIATHESALVREATAALEAIDGVRIIGTARRKASVISFVVDEVHPHDIGTIVDREGVAIRTGHHCAQPVMDRFKIPATARASFAMYNTRDDVQALAEAVRRAKSVLG